MNVEGETMNKNTFEWVWYICSVRTNEGETVPMQRGDRLYICIDESGKAKFHHRSAKSDKNTGLWSKATAEICEKTNTLSGGLPDGRTFTMSLSQEEGVHRLTCKHKRNPDEGEWDGYDDPL
ncbi:MAG: hypothetical protein AAF290_11020 [Pseudomonadota bacterium]